MSENKNVAKSLMWAGGAIAAIITFLASFTTLLNNLGFETRQKQDLSAARVSEVMSEQEPGTRSTESTIDSDQAGASEAHIEEPPEPQAVSNQATPKRTVSTPLTHFPMEAELSRSKSSRTISEIGISMSVVFQALDGEDFATLTMSHLGGPALVEPILGPGSTFQVQGRDERRFAIDVLQIDFSSAVLKLAVREE